MEIICVPKDQDSLKRLDFDETIDGDLMEMFIKEKDYYQLEQTGIFSSVNTLIGSNIDNFEDERITDLLHLEKIMKSGLLDEERYDKTLTSIIEELKNFFQEALERRTGIFFYF